jgi:hypothetical protein
MSKILIPSHHGFQPNILSCWWWVCVGSKSRSTHTSHVKLGLVIYHIPNSVQAISPLSLDPHKHAILDLVEWGSHGQNSLRLFTISYNGRVMCTRLLLIKDYLTSLYVITLHLQSVNTNVVFGNVPILEKIISTTFTWYILVNYFDYLWKWICNYCIFAKTFEHAISAFTLGTTP